MNSKGFSLLETMLSMGLSIIVFLALSSYITNSQKSNRNLMISLDFRNLVNLVSLSLLDTNTCTPNLAPVSFNASSTTLGNFTHDFTKLSYPTGVSFIDKTLPNTEYQISAIQLRSLVSTGSSANTYSAKLHIEAQKLGSYLGAPVVQQDIPLILTASGNSGNVNVMSCSTGANLANNGSGPGTNPTPSPSPSPSGPLRLSCSSYSGSRPPTCPAGYSQTGSTSTSTQSCQEGANSVHCSTRMTYFITCCIIQ